MQHLLDGGSMQRHGRSRRRARQRRGPVSLAHDRLAVRWSLGGRLLVLFRACSRRGDGCLIDTALAQRRQRLVGGLFLREGLLQQPVGLGVTEEQGVRSQAAVGGDLIVLDPLGR